MIIKKNIINFFILAQAQNNLKITPAALSTPATVAADLEMALKFSALTPIGAEAPALGACEEKLE